MHIFGKLVHIFWEVRAYSCLETGFQIFETGFKRFGSIMATMGFRTIPTHIPMALLFPRAKGTLSSEPRFSNLCDMRFGPREAVQMAIWRLFPWKCPFSLCRVGKIACLRKTREGWNCRFQKTPSTEGADKVPGVSTQGSRQVCLSRCPKS